MSLLYNAMTVCDYLYIGLFIYLFIFGKQAFFFKLLECHAE